MPYIDLLDDKLRCPGCPSRNLPREQKKKVVMGCGDCEAKVMLVGESPGKMEAHIGRPFVGKSGNELDNTYLGLAGLSRSECFVTNTVCCHWADSSDAPPDWLVKSCSDFHLRKELSRVQPEFVILMGGVANSLIGLDIDTFHGSGRESSILGWKGWTFSSYHPALGLHIPARMQNLLDDFRKLRDFLRDPKELVDEVPNPSYYRLRTEDEVDAVMDGEYDNPIGLDTESRKVWKGYRSTIHYIPYCLQFCIRPGEAFLVLIEDSKAWKRVGYHINKFSKILIHNALHDFGVMLDSGIKLDWNRIIDTMSMSYGDARLPKGLKPLSYQLLGVTALNFDDVVRPYGIRAAMEYFDRAAGLDWPVPTPEPTGEFTTKNCPKCKGKTAITVGRGKKAVHKDCEECKATGVVTVPKMTRKQGVGAKVSRLLTDYLKNQDIDPWSRWDNWGDAVDPLIEKLGPLPLPSIHLVPEDKIIEYACADAHNCRRVYPILKRRHTELRRSFNGKL